MNRSHLQRQGRRAVLQTLRRHLQATAASPDLLAWLDEAEAELRLGGARLVFDAYDEDGRHDAVLVEEPSLGIGSGAQPHVLIEGENREVLHRLADVGMAKVDVIYIDPPYNTGMTNLGYEDHFSEGQPCRHSRWLSMLQCRLELSRGLMSEKGVLFLHLDENETAHGQMLCAQLFGEDNVVCLVWPKTDSAFDQNRVEKPVRDVKMVHESIILAFKDRANTMLHRIGGDHAEGPLESILRGFGTTSSAKDELEVLLGHRYRFQTPKPMRLIKELVRAASAKDSVVLDFFAGSGTTGHAVMDLNQEDGGARRFILVTNNENGICREVTRERLRRAIDLQGYGAGIRYFVLQRAAAPG